MKTLRDYYLELLVILKEEETKYDLKLGRENPKTNFKRILSEINEMSEEDLYAEAIRLDINIMKIKRELCNLNNEDTSIYRPKFLEMILKKYS